MSCVIAQIRELARTHRVIAQFRGLAQAPFAIDQLWQRVLRGRWYVRSGKFVDAPCLASLLSVGVACVLFIAQFRGRGCRVIDTGMT